MSPTCGLAKSPFGRLPNEVLTLISDALDTRSRFSLSQTCKRLRSNILQDNHTAFRLALVAEEFGIRLSYRRRIFDMCLSLLAADSPCLVVCGSCMDVHNMMGYQYKLPKVLKPEQEKLLALRPLDAPRSCSWKTVGAQNTFMKVRVFSPDHLHVQLALKYKRLQEEDPELLSRVPDWFKLQMEWGMWPMHRFAAIPMPTSTMLVKCYLFWEPRVVRQENGQLRYLVRTVYHQQSCIRNWDAPVKKRKKPVLRLFSRPDPRASSAYEDTTRPLTSEDIVPFSFCPHQIISPQDASPAEVAGAGTGSGRRFSFHRPWRRRGPELSDEDCPSTYTNSLIHHILSNPSSKKQTKQLHTSCTLCPTDIAVRSLSGGRFLQVMAWRDMGPEQGPGNIYWQSQMIGPSLFFGKEPSTLYQTGYFGENRGPEGLVPGPLHHAGSVRKLYESDLKRAEAKAKPKLVVRKVIERVQKRIKA